MTGAYDWWMTALELAGDYGSLTREQMVTLGIHEDEPKAGFYRAPSERVSSGGEVHDSHIAIWPHGGTLVALWDGAPIETTAAWGWCCRYPISEERYRRAERRSFTHPAGFFA